MLSFLCCSILLGLCRFAACFSAVNACEFNAFLFQRIASTEFRSEGESAEEKNGMGWNSIFCAFLISRMIFFVHFSIVFPVFRSALKRLSNSSMRVYLKEK